MLNFLLTHTPLLYFTQSVWRDEAFSMLIAGRSPLSFIGKLSFEPPVYYLLLHYWMKLFGTSEIALRSLSFLGFALATYVVIVWSEQLFHKHWLSWFLPVTFFLNPMLIYYAFEVRTYGWYMFFAVLSMYAYWNNNWKLYIPATVLGFYNHTYMLIVPFVQLVHYLWITPHSLRVKNLIKSKFIRSLALFGLLIAPWMVIVLKEAVRLKQSWFFPVDLQLVLSALGNMFVGYEGTPWFGWGYTRILSLIILGVSFVALKQSKTRKQNGFFFLMMTVPLVIVIGISFIKPLFVNRYLIPVTIAQVFLFTLAIATVKNTLMQKVWAGLLLAFILVFNCWYPSQHAKTNLRATMQQVNTIKAATDLVYAETPLIFFELLYYSPDRSKVYLYNPDAKPFPWYVGDVAFPQSQMASDIPTYPKRAFLVHENIFSLRRSS
jgi:mannosyltransferase